MNSRTSYRSFLVIPTRWMDNDAYGHVNNVAYYSYFDTAVNEHLIRAGGLDIERSTTIGVVVETACRFHKPLSFPDVVEIGLFRQGEEEPVASGHFVHVWVDRGTRRPTAVPEEVRAALESLA